MRNIRQPWLIALLWMCLASFHPQHGLSQNNSAVNLDLAIQLFTNQKFEHASTILEELAQKYPDSAAVFLWQGHTNFELARWKEARNAYKQYLDLVSTPKNKAEACVAIAKTHRMDSNCGLAEEWCQKAALHRPADTSIENQCKETCKQDSTGGFWKIGLFGICGGRSSWWGWLIGLLIYIPGLFMGAFQTGGFYRSHQLMNNGTTDGAGGAAFIMGIIGTAIGYILFWGIPASTMKWILMGFICIMNGGLAWNVATHQE